MSKVIILKTLNKYKENQKTKKTEKKRTKKPEKHKKKRPIPWTAMEKSIKKYDGLSKKEKNIADKTWGRPIPSWRKALKYHKQGLTDNEIRKMKKKQS